MSAILSSVAVPSAPIPKPVLHLSAVANGAFDSKSLLRGTREVLIRHGGETYRLRHTRNDKLILTK